MARVFFTYQSRHLGDSPRSRHERALLFIWEIVWTFCCAWTPKPFNKVRVFVLRVFGARIHPTAFVHQRARIAVPWNLSMGQSSCIGDRANIYSLDTITIGVRAVVAQESYICAGTHDFDNPNLPLSVSPIVIGPDTFIGARAFIMPGVTIGRGAIIGACSVVTSDVPDWVVSSGNPAREIRKRHPSPLDSQRHTNS